MADNDSIITKNPHFERVNRAPYELGNLLIRMPKDFSAYTLATPETCLMAEAAAQHAENANDCLMSGVEALGGILTTAGLSNANEVNKGDIVGIGELIQHMAVEAQFMQEMAGEYRFVLHEQEKLAKKKNK